MSRGDIEAFGRVNRGLQRLLYRRADREGFRRLERQRRRVYPGLGMQAMAYYPTRLTISTSPLLLYHPELVH